MIHPIIPSQVVTEHGLRLLPDVSIADCPPLDIILIPGGMCVHLSPHMHI